MNENITQVQTTPIQNPMPAEVQPKPKNPWLKIGLLSFLGLVLLGGLVYVGYKLWQAKDLERQRGLRIGGLNIYEISCQADSDCVLVQSLMKDACCHCPFAVNNGELGKNKYLARYPAQVDWEKFEAESCKSVLCKPCASFPKASCLQQKCTVINEGLTPTPDPTVGWEIYTGKGVEFKYPSDWEDDGHFITSISPKTKIYVVSKDSTLMNECMRETSTEDKGGFVLRRFTRVTEGEMCSTPDSTPREIWVVPLATAYSPGISYQYLSSEGQLAESIFDQILSTFRFD